MPKKKAGGKKKAASKKKAPTPATPILPVACPTCAALHTPLKATLLCALCFQAQNTAIVFSLPKPSGSGSTALVSDENVGPLEAGPKKKIVKKKRKKKAK
eukprot:m.294534 g.294534  ORF g.294534 m.294534 type:complete len:100 (+) comp46287_c0_seq1:71-370(+)